MESKSELRRELTEAIANISHQIEVQETSVGFLFSGNGPSGRELAKRALEAELAELQAALASLEADEG